MDLLGDCYWCLTAVCRPNPDFYLLIRLHGSTLTCLIWCQKAWTMLEAGHHCWIHAAHLARYRRAVRLVVRLLLSLLAACPALQPGRAACPWAPWVHLCTLHLPNSHRLLHWPGSNGSIHWNLIKLEKKKTICTYQKRSQSSGVCGACVQNCVRIAFCWHRPLILSLMFWFLLLCFLAIAKSDWSLELNIFLDADLLSPGAVLVLQPLGSFISAATAGEGVLVCTVLQILLSSLCFHLATYPSCGNSTFLEGAVTVTKHPFKLLVT